MNRRVFLSRLARGAALARVADFDAMQPKYSMGEVHLRQYQPLTNVAGITNWLPKAPCPENQSFVMSTRSVGIISGFRIGRLAQRFSVCRHYDIILKGCSMIEEECRQYRTTPEHQRDLVADAIMLEAATHFDFDRLHDCHVAIARAELTSRPTWRSWLMVAMIAKKRGDALGAEHAVHESFLLNPSAHHGVQFSLTEGSG